MAKKPKEIVEDKRPVGRPSDFTKEIADRICAELSDGKSLRTVCKSEDMPSTVTVFAWLRSNQEFLNQYTRAKEESADSLADDIQQIADDVISGKIKPDQGRVAGDLKKWTASKLKPKKYGDKLDLSSGGDKIAPIMIEFAPRPAPLQIESGEDDL